jgi:hypothetical protein
VKITAVATFLFVILLSGCGSNQGAASPPSRDGGKASTGSTVSSKGPSGICTYIDGAKTQLQNVKALGANPSMNTLISDLKSLDAKLKSAGSTASATLKPGFTGVETADTALQKSINQLKSSGMPSSAYAQPVKQGVAAIGTSLQALVAASSCV